MDVPCGGSDTADRNSFNHLIISHVKLHNNNVNIKMQGTFKLFPSFSHCWKSSHAFACCFSANLCFALAHMTMCSENTLALCYPLCCCVLPNRENYSKLGKNCILRWKPDFQNASFSCLFCDTSPWLIMICGHFCRWPHMFLIFWGLKLAIQT